MYVVRRVGGQRRKWSEWWKEVCVVGATIGCREEIGLHRTDTGTESCTKTGI